MTIPHLLFAPLVAPWLLVLAGIIGIALILRGVQSRLHIVTRLLPLTALLLALANPRLSQQEVTSLDDIAVVVVDDSPSMSIGARRQQAETALSETLVKLKALPHLDVRVEHYRNPPVSHDSGHDTGHDEGTRLFSAVDRVLADIPRRRLAGVVLITDGQVNDVPVKPVIDAPLHVLLVGRKDERDRRLVIEQSASFGMVGGTASLTFRVEDPGQTGEAEVSIIRDGGPPSHVTVPLNRPQNLDLPVEHAGANVIELQVAAAPNELTLANNRVALSINGVRDRLKVLLLSGEPHAGERVWRNLLKADPAVDLVHFTILRPPEKNDHTPTRELALIPFPVRELFEEKLHGFDLIIFDRFRQRAMLPQSYYQDIADYVKSGGALLVAAGPEFAAAESPFNTALADVLPATPTGLTVEQPFRPLITEAGRRHPVTSMLSSGNSPTPQWGRWTRTIASRLTGSGIIAMQGADGLPLLVLDHRGDGRVAELMSDTAWLWARGWDGGGPQAELLRRLAHWLMKEPELEEDQLTADIHADRLHIERRSLAVGPREVTITDPDGNDRKLPLADQGDGRATGETPVNQSGLWRVGDGVHTALAAVGQLNPVEMAELRATPDKLRPVVHATGGGLHWISDGLPEMRRLNAPNRDSIIVGAGESWFGFRANHDQIVIGLRDAPLIPGMILIAAAFGGLLLSWWREGR